jgi:hypothetical protein
MFSMKNTVAGLLALAVVGSAGSLLAMTLVPAAQQKQVQVQAMASNQPIEAITVTAEKPAS